MALTQGRRRAGIRRPRVGPSDEILLQSCREGDTEAFTALFRRYHHSVLRIAAGTSSTFDPEDLAAESFTRIWAALRDGSGPTQAFLPYARTVVRNVAATWAGRSQEVPTEQDQLEFESQQIYVPNSFEESLSEHELVSSAFATLPGRWQSVLWMTEVEGKRARAQQDEILVMVHGPSPSADVSRS